MANLGYVAVVKGMSKLSKCSFFPIYMTLLYYSGTAGISTTNILLLLPPIPFSVVQKSMLLNIAAVYYWSVIKYRTANVISLMNDGVQLI